MFADIILTIVLILDGMALSRGADFALKVELGAERERVFMYFAWTTQKIFRYPLTWPARASWRTRNERAHQDLRVSSFIPKIALFQRGKQVLHRFFAPCVAIN